MQLFSMDVGQTLLCQTPRCRAEIQTLQPFQRIGTGASPRVEVVLCAVTGTMAVAVAGKTVAVTAMHGIQIGAGQPWTAVAGERGAKLLRVDSFHPGFDPSQALMAPLESFHAFDIAGEEMLIYTDYVRGGVLNFPARYMADKHFHQDADEIFWFFEGSCRVSTPDEVVEVPAGTVVFTPAGEWHIIENAGEQPLKIFLTVTPNIVPSHTFFHPDGTPHVRSMQPLTRR